MQKEQSKDKFKNTAEMRVEKAISKTASASCGQASVDAGKIFSHSFSWLLIY